MKTLTRLLAITLVSVAALTACGGGGGGGGGGGVTNPPPPVANQSPSGAWAGRTVTVSAPDASTVSTSFEFFAAGGFEIGTTPLRAFFSNGNAETRMIPGFYITGLNAWHILNGTSALVSFETLPRSLSFWVRTENATDVSSIQILDSTSASIITVTPTNAYQQIVVCRAAAEAPIESMVVTSTSGGDVVIDDLSFGFPCTTDDIGCLIAESTLEFVCVITEVITDVFVAGAQGTVQVNNGDQVTETTGSRLYAALGTTLADGSTVVDLTLTGTVSEGVSLDLTIAAAGVSTSVTTTFDTVYDRGSDLLTVAGVYSAFDIFGNPGVFTVDAMGVIFSQSMSCVGNGRVSIIDANFNAYDVTLDVTSCSVPDGTYDGLGLTEDDVATDDVFTFAVFTTDSVIVASPTK